MLCPLYKPIPLSYMTIHPSLIWLSFGCGCKVLNLCGFSTEFNQQMFSKNLLIVILPSLGFKMNYYFLDKRCLLGYAGHGWGEGDSCKRDHAHHGFEILGVLFVMAYDVFGRLILNCQVTLPLLACCIGSVACSYFVYVRKTQGH